MNRIFSSIAVVCFAALAAGQTYKVYNTKAPRKDELTAKQAFDKAVIWLRALDKNVKGYELQMGLDEIAGKREWYIVTSDGAKTPSNLSLDPKTGRLRSFRDTDIEMEGRLGKSRPSSVRLSNKQYEGKVQRFLERAGFRQKFTRPEFSSVNRFVEVDTKIYEIYEGLPILDNVIGISLRASDGAFSYVGYGLYATKFAGKVEEKTDKARQKAQAARGTNEKPTDFRLWYARLQDSKTFRKRISEVARPYYIAKYGERWDEVWIDAETGKVARNYRSRPAGVNR